MAQVTPRHPDLETYKQMIPIKNGTLKITLWKAPWTHGENFDIMSKIILDVFVHRATMYFDCDNMILCMLEERISDDLVVPLFCFQARSKISELA